MRLTGITLTVQWLLHRQRLLLLLKEMASTHLRSALRTQRVKFVMRQAALHHRDLVLLLEVTSKMASEQSVQLTLTLTQLKFNLIMEQQQTFQHSQLKRLTSTLVRSQERLLTHLRLIQLAYLHNHVHQLTVQTFKFLEHYLRYAQVICLRLLTTGQPGLNHNEINLSR